MKLRVNPSTGRMAERVPAAVYDVDPERLGRWVSYEFDANAGLIVHHLSDAEVADWHPVVLAPAPPAPEFVFAIACSTCDPHRPITAAHERDLMLPRHEGHDAAKLAVRAVHPDAEPDAPVAPWQAGAAVVLHGSVEGDPAGLLEATVVGPAVADEDMGECYRVEVEGRSVIVPATALHAA